MSSRSKLGANVLPGGGLLVPPLLWAVDTELGLILPYAECAPQSRIMAMIALAGAILSLATGYWCWQAATRIAMRGGGIGFPISAGFLGRLSGLNGLVFGLALIFQGIAALVLTGCER